MIFSREPTIGLFDGLGRRIASHSQDFVIITFGASSDEVRVFRRVSLPRLGFRT